jgi:hypothetical protein
MSGGTEIKAGSLERRREIRELEKRVKAEKESEKPTMKRTPPERDH